MTINALFRYFNFRDLWFIVGINVVSNTGCLLYEILKPKEGANTIPIGRLFEDINTEIT